MISRRFRVLPRLHGVLSTPRRACSTSNRQAKTGGELAVDALVAAGVRTVFGIPGTHTVPIYRALEASRGSITHITTRHESGAGYGADGYARATGEMAAVCVVTGIGLTNTITPMAAALADSVPMVVIASEVPEYWRSRPNRQYSHYVPGVSEAICSSVCKRSIAVQSVHDIAPAVTEACAVARSGRPGPVHVSIPIDLLVAEAPPAAAQLGSTAAAATASSVELSPVARAQLTEAAMALDACERPVIIAGGGAVAAAAHVRLLAERLGATVLTTVAGKGVVDERHALCAGARLHHPPARDLLLERADGLLLLGTQLSPTDYWQFRHDEEVPLPLARLGGRAVHVDLDERSLEQAGLKHSHGTSILADVGVACEQLLTALPVGALDATSPAARRSAASAAAVAEAKRRSDGGEALTSTLMWDFGAAHGGGQQMLRTLGLLRAALPEGAPLVADVCRLGYTALSLYPAHSPASFLYPVGTTALGYGLPAAIGAALALRARGGGSVGSGVVAAIVGDGGLQLSVQELATAAEERLPLLLVVWNDASYGEIRRSLPAFATLTPRPDLGKLCDAYGIHHLLAEDAEGVAAALESGAVKALLAGGTDGAGVGGPVMLEVRREWDRTLEEAGAAAVEVQAVVTAPIPTEAEAEAPTPTEVPKPILGTMTFGWAQASKPVDVGVARSMVETFLRRGGREIDTARMYAEGNTEAMIGEVLASLPAPQAALALLATKANPDEERGGDGTGGLDGARLTAQIDASLGALRTPEVDLFYLHWPDGATPLQETLEATQRAYEAGRFQRLGLSNYTADEVATIHEHMSARGWVAPSVYQGMYNACTRGVEADLLPLLRERDISFAAYNPLAGGLLTGKHMHTAAEDTAEGRFANNEWYLRRYWHADYFAALVAAREACDAAQVPMAEAALRWLAHHSCLDGGRGDGIILGASSVGQLEANLEATRAGPLPEAVTAAWDVAWEVARASAPVYAGYGHSGGGGRGEGSGGGDASGGGGASNATAVGGGAQLSWQVRRAEVANGGGQLDLSFADGRCFRVHAAWLHDSSPANFTDSYVRRDAAAVLRAPEQLATSAVASADGAELTVRFGSGEEHSYDAAWLAAAAPYVGRSLCGARTREIDGMGNLLDEIAREPWGADHAVASFDAEELMASDAANIDFLETMARHGVCTIHNVGAPDSLDQDDVGAPLSNLANRLVGKLYQHPRRRTAHGVMRKKMATSKAAAHLADYDLANPLSMHTDHAFIEGVPGALQFMYQAQGSVRTKVCDGLAVANELRRTDPEAFDLLSTVHFTHALRTVHYDARGDYCHLGAQHDGVFEDCHTHPILELGADGEVAKVIHSETKRGVAAVPFDVYPQAMRAYTAWMRMVEDERFVRWVDWPEHTMLVTNNHRVLHGRATQPLNGTERCMVWGYAYQHISELRYRLLKQQALERSGVSDAWTTRLPNQLVADLCRLREM